MMRKILFPLFLMAFSIFVVGCDDDDGPSSPSNADMNWVLEDVCSDGLGLQARIFDVDRDIVWPSANQVFVSDPGGAVDTTITCRRGSLICYGATTDPETNIFWGLDIDGTQDCDDCCERCDDRLVQFQLTC